MAQTAPDTHRQADSAPVQIADAHVAAPHVATPVLAAPAVIETAKPIAVHVPTKKVGVHAPVARVKRLPASVHVPRLATMASLLRASGQMRLLFNSTLVRLDRPLAAHGNVMFSPFRQIFEFQGGALTWQSKTQTVTATNQARDITLKMGKKRAMVNNKSVTLDAAPYLNQGRTMVPLSFVSTAMDVDIQYDATTGHLQITSRK